MLQQSPILLFMYTNILFCCVCSGSCMTLETVDDCIDKSQPLEVNSEAATNDITDHLHDDKRTTCSARDRQSRKKQQLTDHRKSDLNFGENWRSCGQCEKRFSSNGALRQHMNIHSSKYKCEECGALCHNRNQLTVHRRTHSGEKPFECTVCSRRFTSAGNLAMHSRTHSGEKPYKCQACGKAFSSSGCLNIHMRVHTGDKPYKCSMCSKSFCDSGHLQRHENYVHSNRRPYHCSQCSAEFKTDRDLKRHVRIHTGVKPYSCEHCSDSFTRSDQLKTHLLKLHEEGGWLTCFICEKKFGQSCQLKQHLLTHEADNC